MRLSEQASNAVRAFWDVLGRMRPTDRELSFQTWDGNDHGIRMAILSDDQVISAVLSISRGVCEESEVGESQQDQWFSVDPESMERVYGFLEIRKYGLVSITAKDRFLTISVDGDHMRVAYDLGLPKYATNVFEWGTKRRDYEMWLECEPNLLDVLRKYDGWAINSKCSVMMATPPLDLGKSTYRPDRHTLLSKKELATLSGVSQFSPLALYISVGHKEGESLPVRLAFVWGNEAVLDATIAPLKEK